MADWDKIKSRGKVQDRRGNDNFAVGGVGSLGLVGTLVILAFTVFSGGEINLEDIAGQLQNAQVSQQTNVDATQFEGVDDYEVFASTVVGSNNDMWKQIFSRNNLEYEEPQLVLFRGVTRSACGVASSDIGPHYCPADKTIYIDETFYDELQRRFGAEGGDVAEAYVMSHEMGHHVQNELGTMAQIQANRGSSQANELSVKLELQADCYAGLWANSIKDLGVFGPAEIEEAIDAAAAVGDDRIQSKTTGRIDPESWTHGSSAERVEWFNRGFATGQVSECDTF